MYNEFKLIEVYNMKLKDIVFLSNDTRRKPDLYIVSDVSDEGRVLLRRKDGSGFGWWPISQLTLLYEYPENCISVEDLRTLLIDRLKMKDFEIELHLFPHQQESQDYWGGYRGFWIKNDAWKVQIQFQNTFYVECLMPSFSSINYFWQKLEPSYDNINKILSRSRFRIDQMLVERKKEIEILS